MGSWVGLRVSTLARWEGGPDGAGLEVMWAAGWDYESPPLPRGMGWAPCTVQLISWGFESDRIAR